ncbi:helicase-related protein [Catelliglobosispora koreensis]|uniref:helicase-related protein n=1 Tax=Catelliglobosispora koreensis TaxID=129052 RepID=UPI00036E8D7A|nr:helicase-related protein [Catelliglobosispora koreensis]
MRLEELVPGIKVLGVVAGGPVELVAVSSISPDAVKVIYTAGSELQQQILFRVNEPHLSQLEERHVPYDASPEDFKLAAEALRIQTAARTDPMLAVTSSALVPLPHQVEAVYGELLERVPLRFLLADDPGAGKTIMAGLFIKELQLRGDLERCLIVAPGGLVEQWQDELAERLGLQFSILSSDDIAALGYGQRLFRGPQRLIARMDQLARKDALVAQLRLARWDLVVVDEAHRMAARFGPQQKVIETRRYSLGKALRDTTQHLLLMTATPHSGKEEDFQLFLRLLDPDRFAGQYRDQVHPAGADELMIRRVKEELLTLDGRPLFPMRAAYTVPYALSAAEQELYDQVTAYVTHEFNRVDQLRQENDARGNTVGFALTVLQRRLASSPEAILRSLERRQERLERALAETATAVKRKASKSRSREMEPEDVDEYAAADRETTEDELADAATASRSADELIREIAALKLLVETATKVRSSGIDRKWTELKGLLTSAPQISGPDGDPRKIIIFTEHRDTLTYLVSRITELLGRRNAVVAIHGSVARDARKAIQNRFNNDPTCLILVATDAAGEGLNLQRSHLMVNYDLPWNPNRIEQRFGRVHRIGQTEMCHLWNLVAYETREGAVFKTLLDKIAQMNQALGDKIFDVLGEAFEGQPLQELLIEAIRFGEQPHVKTHLSQIIDKRIGDFAKRLAEEKALHPNLVGMSDVARLRKELEDARLRRLQPHYIEGFFRDAMRRAGGDVNPAEAGRFSIPHIPTALRDRTANSGSLPLRYDRICFDAKDVEVTGKPKASLIFPGHTLLETLIESTLDQYRDALIRGTVLVDRQDNSEEPRLMVALSEEIIDGTNRAVAKRFEYVEMTEDGESRPGPAPFLDYDRVREQEFRLLDGIKKQAWLSSAAKTAELWATSSSLPAWFEQVASRRRQFVAKARSLVVDRLKQEISLWEHETSRLASGQSSTQGVSLRTASEEVELLKRRLEKRTAELNAQEHTQVTPPVVEAVAIVIPQGFFDAASGKPELANSREVEMRAIEAVVAAERQLGREAQIMPPNNPGYDLRSVGPEGALVHIEVKGRAEGADDFFVTNREIRTGQNSDHYRLALVEVGQEVRIRYVDDPFAGLAVTALVNGVQFKWADMWEKGTEPH